MAYFNGGIHGWNDPTTGRYVPAARTTRIYCDDCAESAIPLPDKGPNGDRVGRHWGTDFKWAPVYGGSTKCHQCGEPS